MIVLIFLNSDQYKFLNFDLELMIEISLQRHKTKYPLKILVVPIITSMIYIKIYEIKQD